MMKAEKNERARPEQYYGLARFLAKRAHGTLPVKYNALIEIDDLFQQGVLGLLEALKKFSPNRKTKFTTFATIYIRGRIFDYIRAWCRVPQKKWQKIQWLLKSQDKLSQVLKREPTTDELANYLGISPEAIEQILSWRIDTVSFGEIVKTEKNGLAPEPVSRDLAVDKKIDLKKVITEIERYISHELNNMERWIYRMRICMGEKPLLISKLLGIPVGDIYLLTNLVRSKLRLHLSQRFGNKHIFELFE